MRFLFLSNYYPPHHFGGYEELCDDAAQGLRSRGHQVTVLTSDHGAWNTCGADQSVRRVLHPEIDHRPHRAAFDFFLRRRQYLHENLARLRETMADCQPDVLMVWGMWNLPRALLAEAESWGQPPIVYYIADYWPTLPDAYILHWQQPARRWYTRLPKLVLGQIALRQAAHDGAVPQLRFDHVLCVSDAVRKRLIECGLTPGNIRVMYNGIDASQFAGAQNEHRQGHGSSPLSVVYAGRLTADKGVHTAIEAIGRLKRKGCPVKLTIIGGGGAAYEMALRDRVRQLQVADCVEFRGRVPREQMPAQLVQFDVLVVPSLWAEPMPRIAQEGMASGLVVIGASVGGMPEILVEGKNGLLFDPGDASILADQIGRLVEDSGLCARLAEAGKQTVSQRFAIRRMIDEFEEYLARIADAGQ